MDYNSEIITINRRYQGRISVEAWHINSGHAPLDRDDGGLWPDNYLHLTDKNNCWLVSMSYIDFRLPLLKAPNRSFATLDPSQGNFHSI